MVAVTTESSYLEFNGVMLQPTVSLWFATGLACMALSACASETGPISADAGSVASLRFVFVALLEGQIGGRAGSSRTFHVGDHRLTESEESTAGQIRRLRSAPIDTAPVFDAAARIAFRPPPEERSGGNMPELPAYFAPKVVFGCNLPPDGRTLRSYTHDEVPAALSDLVALLDSTRDEAPLVTSERGLYARAQRIGRANPHTPKPDLTLSAAQADAYARLTQLLKNEMSLVRIAALGDAVRVGGNLSLVPARPVHIQIGAVIYRIVTFEFDPDSGD